MYSLVKIIDTHSSQKSKFASDLCKYSLYDRYNIEYISCIADSDDAVKCENNVVKKNKDTFSTRKVKCNKKIFDVFVLKDICGKHYNIGNNCIQTFLQANKLSNIDINDFKFINKLLKAKKHCLLCGKNSNKGIHKKCVNGGICDEKYIVSPDMVNIKITLNLYIKINYYLKKLRTIFSGVCLINRTYDALYKNDSEYDCDERTLTALSEACKKYKDIIKYQKKLLKLKNNCIVNSVKTQRRFPSVKQLAILEKILKDYKRIRKIDKNNKNKNYIKYGYVY